MTTKPKKAAKSAAKSNGHDDFDQGGPDGPTKQRGKGDNSKKFDGGMVQEALIDISIAEHRMTKRLEEANKKNQADREKIKAIKGDLVDSGVPAKELNTLLRKQKLEKKLETIDAALGEDQKETFAQLVEALDEYAETPLGRAALKRNAPTA